MFFDSVEEVRRIAKRTGAAVFVVPDDVVVEVPGAIVVQPEEKATITIDQMRLLMGGMGLRQTADLYVLIRPADKLGVEAANAFLKSLEEPGEKVHYILVTAQPSQLLPTILSRCAVYFLRAAGEDGIHAEAKVKDLAKRLMVAKGDELVAVAEEIARKKDGVRMYALSVVGVAVEMLYKTYLITGKEAFLARLPKFLATYEALAQNGNVKLQIVAGLG